MTKPFLILGGGGHARVLIETLYDQGEVIEAIVAPELRQVPEFKGAKHLRHDSDVEGYQPNSIKLVNAIGSLPNDVKLREQLFKRFKSAGYSFSTVVSDTATLSKYVQLSEGTQVLPRAILNACQVGVNTIINTGAIIEHDVIIGSNCHIAPGAIICGNVSIGDNVHIGAGAVVIQGIRIADGAIVGAGSIVKRDLSATSVHYPAKPFIKEGSK
ncbi:acetyltransferase [Idiomarina loihiensis]|uniref:acetyltransferase n=1 Tax=Idiomarina loihiensis TaxID=135577 RepID=UPI0031585F5A